MATFVTGELLIHTPKVWIGLITNSYPEPRNPYRIIPLITESYP